jgi:pantoate--beta-alanine ligase
LALSSRNRYLSLRQRLAAPTLYRTLTDCAAKIKAGVPLAAALDAGRKAIAEAGLELDYFEARNAETLEPLSAAGEPIRLLIAARLGMTRLIDNIGL